MTTPIAPIGPGTAGSTAPSPLRTGESPGSFVDSLKSLVENADSSAAQANTAINGMLDKSVDVHDAMIALQRSEMSLELAVQVRNKLVQAYQDIMRMPV